MHLTLSLWDVDTLLLPASTLLPIDRATDRASDRRATRTDGRTDGRLSAAAKKASFVLALSTTQVMRLSKVDDATLNKAHVLFFNLTTLVVRRSLVARSSLARSIARDRLLARLITRSLDRSLHRSIAHSIVHSNARLLDRSHIRSNARSLARSLTRCFALSLAHSLAASLARSIARAFARSLDRSLTRSLARLLAVRGGPTSALQKRGGTVLGSSNCEDPGRTRLEICTSWLRWMDGLSMSKYFRFVGLGHCGSRSWGKVVCGHRSGCHVRSRNFTPLF